MLSNLSNTKTINNWFRTAFWILLIPVGGFSQTIFGPQNIITGKKAGTHTANFVFSADLDGDGDQDVLVASRGDNKISWYENTDGTGHFGAQRVISEQISDAYAVHAADLDGDGDQDVLAAARGNDAIVWFENTDAQGNFSSLKTIDPNAGLAESVYATDIDGDGDQDVLSVATGSDFISWFENIDGQGNFVLHQELTGADAPKAGYTADIDNDGDQDILSASFSDNKIAWYENEDGEGRFGDQQIISTEAKGAVSVYTADIDNDGDQDVLSASILDDKIAWYENLDGAGNFGAQQIISMEADGAEFVRATDIDGDGDLDVLSASTHDKKVAWYENEDGKGRFSTPKIISLEADGAASVHATDIDNDGDLDVLSASFLDHKVAWHENEDGVGNFGAQQLISAPLTDGASYVYAADVDGDGDNDILSASSKDNKIAWYENEDGRGKFGLQKVISTSVYGTVSVYATDMDGDGDLDVLSFSPDDVKIVWFENEDGVGQFGSERVLPAPPDYLIIKIYPTDYDNDGDIDVLWIATDPNNDLGLILFSENEDGIGNFRSAMVIAENLTKPLSIFSVDLNLDNYPDAVYSHTDDDELGWFENGGINGPFFVGQKNINSGAERVVSIFASDIDNDGLQDILTGATWNGNITWYKNEDELGNFGAQQVISSQADSARFVFAADFDNDGDQDVLGALGNSGKVVWYINEDGAGQFGLEQIITEQAYGAESVYAADLDGDGDLDVLSASILDDKIAWYENLLNASTLSGTCFFDRNQNKVKDSDETGLANHSVVIMPDDVLGFSESNGAFRFAVGNGTYTLSAQPDTDWELTTDSAEYTVTVVDNTFQNLNFGLYPINDTVKVEAICASAATRCNFQVPFWINYENTGTFPASGYVTFEYDSLTSVLSTVPEPDSVSADTRTLFWNYEKLPPSFSDRIQLSLQMPDVDFIDSTVNFVATTYVERLTGNLEKYESYEYSSVISCSYDPNDKLVRPKGIREEAYTLFGEQLEYTVRFQNTGTDTAFTVKIKDELDDDLDWATFRPVAASHPHKVSLYGNAGLVEFIFDNILLPDSSTNEPASHGYIKYRINPLSGLPENTEIHNTASIFFDFNPAIVTNTTLNTLVSELPTSSATSTERSAYLHLYPNPLKENIFVELGNLPGNDYAVLRIRDVYGKLTASYQISPDTKLEIDGNDWTSGIYFYDLEINGNVIQGGKLIKQ